MLHFFPKVALRIQFYFNTKYAFIRRQEVKCCRDLIHRFFNTGRRNLEKVLSFVKVCVRAFGAGSMGDKNFAAF